MQNIPTKWVFLCLRLIRPGEVYRMRHLLPKITSIRNLFVFDRSVDKFPRIKFPRRMLALRLCVLDLSRRGYFPAHPHFVYGLCVSTRPPLFKEGQVMIPVKPVIEADLSSSSAAASAASHGGHRAAGKAGCKNVVIMEKCHARQGVPARPATITSTAISASYHGDDDRARIQNQAIRNWNEVQ